MEWDTDKIDEMALAVMFFSMFDEKLFDDTYYARMWKGLSWAITDRMHEKGWIADPRSKNKSVVVSEEGRKLAEELAVKYFARK
ncbi:MAG TPA: hypothetical protein DGT21_09600 [Armatimonadetes bacterium]|nr:hypothetical protein [Armatimonadota bacterium]